MLHTVQPFLQRKEKKDLAPEALVVLMKRYPSMKVEMVAHPDSHGTEIRMVDIDEPISFSYMDNAPEVIDRKD